MKRIGFCFLFLIGFSPYSFLLNHVSGISQKSANKEQIIEDKASETRDTSYINAINHKALKYQRILPDSAFFLAYEALNHSTKNDYKKGIADACYALGMIHLVNYNKDDSSAWYLNRAFNLYAQSENYKGMGMVCFGLAYVYSFKGELAESEKQLQKSLAYFKRISHKQGMHNAYNALSYIAKQHKDYDKAIHYLRLGIELIRELNDTAALADALNNMGNIHKDQGLFRPAIDAYFKSLTLSESLNDSNGLAIAYGSIGNLYYFQKNYKESLKFFKKKLPISQSTKSYWEISKTYNSMAMAHNELNMPDTAVVYLYNSLAINLDMNYMPGIANVYQQLAQSYLLMENSDSANYYIKKAIELGEKSNTKANLAEYYIVRGRINLTLENEELALKDILKGYSIAKEQNMALVVTDASLYLSQIYFLKDNSEQAYIYLSEHLAMKDSLTNAEHLKNITRLELEYEFEKKERKMLFDKEQERLNFEAKIKQQRVYFLGAIGLFIFIILSGILFFRQKSLNMKFKTIELEQRLLRAQMNPHFIFNSLCSIQDFILKNNNDEANKFLTRFAILMRSILENSRKDFIPLEKEIETLKNYLEIQKLRFEINFDYHIIVEESIDPETFSIPPMLAQPFVENSIEHGFLEKKDKGKLCIKYSLSHKMIQLEVTDNGIGRVNSEKNKSAKEKYGKSSLSTILTRERLNFYKKSNKEKVKFQISDLGEDDKSNGTKVLFNIPYQITIN